MSEERSNANNILKAGLASLLKVFTLACVAGVIAGALGRWHFVLDLASHFRAQVTIALLVSALLFWPLRQRRWSAFCLILGSSLAATLVPYFGFGNRNNEQAYRLLSMNVLRVNTRKEDVIDYIRQQNPDFVLLQETDAAWVEALNQGLAETWTYRKAVPQENNFGISLYSKIPWTSCDVIDYSERKRTPSITATFELEGNQSLRIIGTHPVPPMRHRHWMERNELLMNLGRDVREGMAERTIVAGDLNCSPWSVYFSDLLSETRLKNSACGHGLGISWMPFGTQILGLPIDHVLVGEQIEVFGRVVGPDIGSDHRPIVVDFQ